MRTTIARLASFSVTPASRMSCGPMSELAGDVTEDAFLGGKLRLRQLKSGHRAGVGAAGLAVARRVAAIALVLVEIDERLAELARGNAITNAIAAETIVLDVTSSAENFAAAGLAPDGVDVVLMNPPFNDAARHRASPDSARAVALVAATETLEEWVHASRRILKSGGHLAMIWRADGIADVLAALGRGFGSLMILPIHPDARSPAIRVLVRATKGGRAPTRLLAGLVLNDEAGHPTSDVQSILAGDSMLPLAMP